MNIHSTTTALSLLFVWFAVVVFTATTILYYVFSSRVWRLAESGAAQPVETAARLRRSHDLSRSALEWGALAFVVILMAALSANAVGYFQSTSSENQESEREARDHIKQQERSSPVSPTLLLSAYDDLTTSGLSARIGSSIVVAVKLHDARQRTRKCNRRALLVAARHASVRIESTELKLSPRPVFDDTATCFVTWKWVGVPQHGGTTAALAELTLRKPNGEAVHVSKPVYLSVTRESSGLLTSSLTTILVGFLSLVGVLVTAWMNRQSKARETR